MILKPKLVQKEGFIYKYNSNGNFGHFQIEVTSRMQEVRLRDWQKKVAKEMWSRT